MPYSDKEKQLKVMREINRKARERRAITDKTVKAKSTEIQKEIKEEQKESAQKLKEIDVIDIIPQRDFYNRFLNILKTDDVDSKITDEIKQAKERKNQLHKQINALLTDFELNNKQTKNESLQFFKELELSRKIKPLFHELDLNTVFIYGLDFARTLLIKKSNGEKENK